ncbi:hypothetical protein GJ744_006990 [Endocarpon pusillum]|uniref:NB-ARC domain-containing protein n=1 Tax=Endocarpon pusillum TaxID=364733 RepID=A0A8H7A4S3_9EURO|nr:hypothetical protein GJ744_006990 [Endocarpon pusillum]
MTTASSDRSLSDYLPPSAHGSIVITSRSREVAEGLIEYAEDIFEVGPMREEDAIVLLSKRLKKAAQDNQSKMTRFARDLNSDN